MCHLADALQNMCQQNDYLLDIMLAVLQCHIDLM